MADQDPAAGTPGPRSTGPRLAHDLRAIREARNVTLDEVQRETRMPGDILRRFEAGELVNDPHYNEVYLRNLLKSYAQALGISPQEVISAFDKAKSGAYDGELRRRYVEKKAASEEPARAAPPKPAEEPRPTRKPPPASGGTAPAVAALSSPPKKPAEAKPAAARASEPLPKRRVQSATTASQPIEKSWGLIIGGTIAALAVIGLILWFLFRGTGPEPEVVEVPPAAVDTSAAAAVGDTEATPPDRQTIPPGPQLQTPIQVTVIAAGGALQGFRVTEGSDARRPYWLEEGQEQTFQSDDEVIIWGEGSDEDYAITSNMRLRMQGIEWDPQDGQVLRIDRQRGQALLDSLHRAQYSGTAG